MLAIVDGLGGLKPAFFREDSRDLRVKDKFKILRCAILAKESLAVSLPLVHSPATAW